MRTRRPALPTSSKKILAVHVAVAVFCFAAALIDTITVLMVNTVVGCWIVFTTVVTFRQHQRIKKFLAHVDRTAEILKPGGSGNSGDLPPEDQEEIQVTWARHVLNQEH